MKDIEVEKNLHELSLGLVHAEDCEFVKAFLHCLLTPAEINDIAGRWALVKHLEKKVPQREIAKKLGISLCKITRGARELRKPNSAFQRMLDICRNMNKS